jgi:Ca2+-binding EF-hand superfamily protein
MSFHSQETLKQASLMYIGNWLVENKEKEKLAAVFKQLDTDSDGVLSKLEVKQGFIKHLGRQVSDSELAAMFAEVDLN